MEEILQEISNEHQNQEVKDIISALDNLNGSVEEMIQSLEKMDIVGFSKHGDKQVSEN